eukprot:TRINITY_DN3659_c0_g1_i4.p1 TRINITY_DN3659_c0_g1~~TRINITY_DN3659_c0_g1_i4.p1  ORF type:complete len:699 (-),score=82.85 TRINITY_DN3659_c0_g1_i4:1479-3575(-)
MVFLLCCRCQIFVNCGPRPAHRLPMEDGTFIENEATLQEGKYEGELSDIKATCIRINRDGMQKWLDCRTYFPFTAVMEQFKKFIFMFVTEHSHDASPFVFLDGCKCYPWELPSRTYKSEPMAVTGRYWSEWKEMRPPESLNELPDSSWLYLPYNLIDDLGLNTWERAAFHLCQKFPLALDPQNFWQSFEAFRKTPDYRDLHMNFVIAMRKPKTTRPNLLANDPPFPLAAQCLRTIFWNLQKFNWNDIKLPAYLAQQIFLELAECQNEEIVGFESFSPWDVVRHIHPMLANSMTSFVLEKWHDGLLNGVNSLNELVMHLFSGRECKIEQLEVYFGNADEFSHTLQSTTVFTVLTKRPPLRRIVFKECRNIAACAFIPYHKMQLDEVEKEVRVMGFQPEGTFLDIIKTLKEIELFMKPLKKMNVPDALLQLSVYHLKLEEGEEPSLSNLLNVLEAYLLHRISIYEIHPDLRCEYVVEVDLSGCHLLTRTFWRHAASIFPNLKKLDVGDCPYMYPVVSNNQFRALEYLSVSSTHRWTEIRDDDIFQLLQLCPALKSLNCAFCFNLGDSSVEHFPHHTPLEMIDYSGTSITNRALGYFASIGKLKCLNVSGCDGITIVPLMSVDYLIASCRNLTDVSVSANISTLDLSWSGVKDDSLLRLCQNPHLKQVNLYQCRELSLSTVKHARESCPSIQWIIGGPYRS